MELEYIRDLPDGSRVRSYAPLERLEESVPYFDDFLKISNRSNTHAPLEFYNFGKERSYPSRTLNRIPGVYLLHYITNGAGTVNGKQLHKGQGFLMLPDRPSIMSSDKSEPWHFNWIAFGGSDAMLLMRSVGLGEKELTFDFEFTEQTDRLIDDVLYKSHDGCDISTYLRGVFYIMLSSHKLSSSTERICSDSSKKYVEEAVSYINEHYCEEIRIEALARELHISRKYLCSAFSKHMGMSTKDYLLLRRIEAAADLLISTDLSISEIAQKVGYGDYTQLSRLFREKRGISPLQYRLSGEHITDGITFLAE